jgi:hypothetical protein
LACFGAAQAQDVPSGRGMPKIMIETDDSVDFGVGKVERTGDDWDSGLVDIPELFLQGVQNWQESAWKALQFLDAG